MAVVLSVEQLRCCICLDTYKKPVSIPCGHNFCLKCIVSYWDTMVTPRCPLCKETFSHRPALRTNKTLSIIVDCHRRSKQEDNDQEDWSPETEQPSQTQAGNPGDIACDVCCGNKLPAVKSCLVCQASYCETHAISHQRAPVLRRHWLIDPVTFPTRNLCRKHKQPLVMFCNRDQTPLCVQCAQKEHKRHETVPIEKLSHKVKTHFSATKSGVQQMIQTRLKRVEEIKNSIEISKKTTEKEIECGLQTCSTLIQAVERHRNELLEGLGERQRVAEKRAEDLVDELMQEIDDMRRRNDELQHLEHTENHLHLLQCFVSLNSLPPPKDWSEVRARTDNCLGTVRRTVSKLVGICQELERELSVEEADRMKQYAAEVSLDPATASGWLVLSADKKEVSSQLRRTTVPYEPLRFDACPCILGKQGFTGEQHYWEVQVGDKTDWDLGVAKESISRKGAITVRPDCGYWAICRRKGGNLSACTGPSTPLHLQHTPQRVGVFLDYEKGVISFYDAEAKSHIYTYSGCEFTEAIYPYFNPCVHDNGKNTGPLVICPIERGVKEEVIQENPLEGYV
ncbi:E3 ubiquitin-protein ligase TRIM39-like [Genypterus blacodes]|uniref:E3 ubiquitin-protein ligase TRIM39-like n=1 Tax=Genypterus blacodes TaxID=154954 RepID=UPI003F777143